MPSIDDLHLLQLLQLRVVAFGVDEKNTVASQDPSLCHESDQVTLTRPAAPVTKIRP